jgi:hypothetical protein
MSIFDKNLIEKTPLRGVLEQRFNYCCNEAIMRCWVQNVDNSKSIENSIGWSLFDDFDQWINFRDGRKLGFLLTEKDLKVNFFRDSDDKKCMGVTYTVTLYHRKNKENKKFEFNRVYSLTPVGLYGPIQFGLN